jgi:nucleoside-diphosphate-sugar epimerase
MLPIRTVAITGGLGNLATKLLRHLATIDGIERLIGLDLRPAPTGQAAQVLEGLQTNVTLDYVECDLRDVHDARWRNALAGVDTIVHFAADNPYPQGVTQYQHYFGV